MSLCYCVQCWIYKYLLSICDRRVVPTTAGSPRAKRWKRRHAHSRGVVKYKKRIDALTIDDVNWTPYTCYIVDEEVDDAIIF